MRHWATGKAAEAQSRKPGDLPSLCLPPESAFRAVGRRQAAEDHSKARRVNPGEETELDEGPANQADDTRDDSVVTIVVCASCRDANGSDAHPRAGHLLGLAAREAAADTNIAVTQVECLGNCKRRLSAALLRDGCWSYVFGDLTPDSGADLVAGAQLFADSTDGLIPWRGRPDSLKRGLVARIPPFSQLKVIA